MNDPLPGPRPPGRGGGSGARYRRPRELVNAAIRQPESDHLEPGGYAALYKTISQAFGTNLPRWDQYLHFWDGLVHGNLGVSIFDFPAQVTTLNFNAIPYTRC